MSTARRRRCTRPHTASAAALRCPTTSGAFPHSPRREQHIESKRAVRVDASLKVHFNCLCGPQHMPVCEYVHHKTKAAHVRSDAQKRSDGTGKSKRRARGREQVRRGWVSGVTRGLTRHRPRRALTRTLTPSAHVKARRKKGRTVKEEEGHRGKDNRHATVTRYAKAGKQKQQRQQPRARTVHRRSRRLRHDQRQSSPSMQAGCQRRDGEERGASTRPPSAPWHTPSCSDRIHPAHPPFYRARATTARAGPAGR